MRILFIFSFCCFLLSCAGDSSSVTSTTTPVSSGEAALPEDGFFPVTEYILGQITDIKNSAVNPLKKWGKDSSWIKIENLEKEFQPFLNPIIDTGNMKPLFRETKFLDKTINAYTFVYEPKVMLPDSMELRSWLVYVDPKKNQVKKIYMTKSISDKQLQLTWESGKGCNIRTIVQKPDDQPKVESEIQYQWDF